MLGVFFLEPLVIFAETRAKYLVYLIHPLILVQHLVGVDGACVKQLLLQVLVEKVAHLIFIVVFGLHLLYLIKHLLGLLPLGLPLVRQAERHQYLVLLLEYLLFVLNFSLIL